MIAVRGVVLAAALACLAAARTHAEATAPVAAAAPDSPIRSWPAPARLAALALIEEYGEPRRLDPKELVWGQEGRRRRIAVVRDAPRKFSGRRRGGAVSESLPYFAPDDALAALRRFDDRLSFDRGTGQLTSRAESEPLNFLALNLADDIVSRRTDEE